MNLICLENPDASLATVSLPLPDDADYALEVDQARCQSVPVGFWPQEQASGAARRVRRALAFMEKQPGADPVAVLTPRAVSDDAGEPQELGWRVEVVPVHEVTRHRDDQFWHYSECSCEARLEFGGIESRFALAVENESGLHLWQFVQAQKLWSGPLVEAWRIGGHIYTGEQEPFAMERLSDVSDLLLYPDDTIAADVHLLLFANGAVQVTAHWVNGRIYGGVGDQKGVPVVVLGGTQLPEGAWDGSNPDASGSGVSFSFSPSSHLVSPEHPGAFTRQGDDSLWHPFEDTRIPLRHVANEGRIEEVLATGSEEGLRQGAARSATWLLGLGSSRPKIGRHIAPPDWYSQCHEFAPFPLELSDGEYDRLGRACAEALLRNSLSGSFISGGIYRYLDQYGLGEYELSLDANEGRSLFLRAYRDSDARFYDLALRNSYFMADIATDHSRDIIHYHNDKPEWRAYSLIYQRFSGIVFGYLETGDPYLLETAEAVARNYMSLHAQNWPRQGIGRDADPLASFLVLWDYTGNRAYLDFAREYAHDISLVIRENGEWLSGAGVGALMGCNAMVGGAWNGGHLLIGFAEYAMRDPDLPRQWLENAGRAVRRICDLLEERHDGYDSAASGFLGRTHWYIACRLGDHDLIDRTHKLMGRILGRAASTDEPPIFTGPGGHHQNNYVDFLMFYEATRASQCRGAGE